LKIGIILVVLSKKLLIYHSTLFSLASFLIFLFYLSRPQFPSEVRLWRALADTAFIFLFITLALGPLTRLFPRILIILPWRRFTGIWFAILALSHALRVLPFALTTPNIQLPFLLGSIALFWTLILALTSSEKAVKFLGPQSWKWLHSMAYVIFYLVVGHAAYFLFWRYNEPNWFRYPFLIMAFTIPILQMSAFIKIVIQRRRAQRK
jgi:sulfoxide reductase heme-binding subunit YedZ